MKCTAVLILVIIIVVSNQSSQWKGDCRENELPARKNINSCSNHNKCPTWFTCDSNKTCQCGDSHDGKIACDDKRFITAVLDCNCVTYDEISGSTFVGSCFYNCGNLKKKKDLVYHHLPMKPELLISESVCSNLHRTGLLCGDCEEGYSPFVLSYNLSCVECPDGHKNWWKFILAGLVPLTFFYFFIIVFKINVTSSRLSGVVWFSQTISIPVLARVTLLSYSRGNQVLLYVVKAVLVFYSFWNLELFRSVIPDICLNVTTLQALALEFIVALYPLVLLLLTYGVIELYDKNFPCMLIMWKPFHKVFAMLRKSWNIRTSVIDSFATFFLLSYVKVLNVTADLLVPTNIYQLGSNISTFGLYYSPTVNYFGEDHLPYALIALFILASLVITPTAVLILYPFQFFQTFLSHIPINWHFLHAFVDSFQGCYKDGTEPGTLDCRWFSVLLLLIRLLLFVIFSITPSVMFFVYSLIILISFLIAMVNIQPCKKVAVRYPSTDPHFLVLLSLCNIVFLARQSTDVEMYYFYTVVSILGFSSAFVPIFYFIFLIISWLFSKNSNKF